MGLAAGPAVDLAKRGLHVDWYAALVIASSARDLARDPDAAALYLDDGQWPKGSGWTALADQRLDQSKMAETLEQLAREGEEAFYRGDIAAALVRDVTDKGGFLSMDDMRDYAATWSDPLSIPFRDGTVYAMPGLTAYSTLADALARWQDGYDAADADSPAAHVARANGLRAAYADRLTNMGDHDSAKAPGCTTHFSIVDSA